MKLAEALALRADVQKNIEGLRERIIANARYQEGETPAEDASSLLKDADEKITSLQTLIAAINATNAALLLADGRTMTAALAERDALRIRHGLLSAVAQAGSTARGYRQMRSELRELVAVDVPSVRSEAEAVAVRLRELDGQIQEANWSNTLLDH